MLTLGIDGVWHRSRASWPQRVDRLRARRWQIGQCAAAAAVAWWVATTLLDHPVPIFASIVAVLTLGTSYAQRLRRVVEVAVGVAVGLLIADLVLLWLGTGWWQLGVVVLLAMSAASLLDDGLMFMNQAALQSMFVLALLPGDDGKLTRWVDALVGGGVALVAATLVPSAALRKPRQQAALVLDKVAELLRGGVDVLAAPGGADTGGIGIPGSLRSGEEERRDAAARALELLAEARATEPLVRQMQHAADEGMAVVTSSPFRVRHRPEVRRMAELVTPLDRAMRSTRVLVRQVAVASYHHRPIPSDHTALLGRLADATDVVAAELRQDRMAVAARPALLAVGEASSRVRRSPELAADSLLAQVRSVVVDLLMITGLTQLEATDSIPPPSEEHRG